MKEDKYTKWLDYSLGLFALLSVAVPNLTSVSILILAIFIILAYVKKSISFQWNKLTQLFTVLYLVYLIGVLFTDNTEIASKYLEYKLSFIIFPFLLSFKYKNRDFTIKWPIIGLILGVLIAGVYGVVNAFICQSNGGESCFVTVSISPVHHPTYFMTYVVLAISGAWYGRSKKWKFFSLYWIVPYTVLGVLLHTYALSFSGLLFLILVFGAILLYFIYKKFGKVPAIILVVLFPIIAFVAIKKIPSIRGEYEGSVKYVAAFVDNPTQFIKDRDPGMSGSEQRLVMWLVSIEQIKEHPFGAGTGNVDDVLGDRLRELGRNELAKKNLNPHNQYLQTTVEIGFSGLIVLLSIIILVFIYAMRNKNWLLLLVISSLAFNSLFESMLQRQSGIVFYTFWICLLLLLIKKQPETE